MEERRNIREAVREAEAKPLEFDPKTRAKYVRDCVWVVEGMMKDRKPIQEIKERIPSFVRDYKNLFEMITDPNGYNKESLNTMLAMLDRMGTGDLTQHQASVIVGQRLAQKFITPNVPSSSPTNGQ
jgi:hypothetical protein